MEVQAKVFGWLFRVVTENTKLIVVSLLRYIKIHKNEVFERGGEP